MRRRCPVTGGGSLREVKNDECDLISPSLGRSRRLACQRYFGKQQCVDAGGAERGLWHLSHRIKRFATFGTRPVKAAFKSRTPQFRIFEARH